MTLFRDKDRSARPTKSRILAALYFLIDSSREIGERALADDLNRVACDHDNHKGRSGDVLPGVGGNGPKASPEKKDLGVENG